VPEASINGVRLYYEITGEGSPLILAHEFGGDCRSWDPQVRFFARHYQVVTYNARGYPPSEVPTDPAAYSQDAAVGDLHGLMRHLGIARAHLCGLSMGAYAVLHVGLRYPEMARSLVVAGCGYGTEDPERFKRDAEEIARRIDERGMAAVGPEYAHGPTRVQLMRKDPQGWREFRDALARHSGVGSAATQRGVQARRPSLHSLEPELRRLAVPTLIVSGDEDDACLRPGLFLKQHIAASGLVVLPVTGHTINLEEPAAFNGAVLDFLSLVEAGRWPTRDPRSKSRSLLARDP